MVNKSLQLDGYVRQIRGNEAHIELRRVSEAYQFLIDNRFMKEEDRYSEGRLIHISNFMSSPKEIDHLDPFIYQTREDSLRLIVPVGRYRLKSMGLNQPCKILSANYRITKSPLGKKIIKVNFRDTGRVFDAEELEGDEFFDFFKSQQRRTA